MTPPDAAAETGERRIIADGIRSYEDLLNAFRLRIREQGLAISAEANTEIAGLSDRYLQKIVGSRPVKRIGVKSFGPILGLLGVRLVMVEDEQAQKRLQMLAEKYGRQLKIREANLVRAAAAQFTVTHRFLSKIGRKGALVTNGRLTPHQRRRNARKARPLACAAAETRAHLSANKGVCDAVRERTEQSEPLSLRPKKFAGDDLDAAACSAASRPAQRFQQTDAHDFDAPHRHRDRAEDFA